MLFLRWMLPKLFFQFADESVAEHEIETDDVSTGVEEDADSFFKKDDEGDGEKDGAKTEDSPTKTEEEGTVAPTETGDEPSGDTETKDETVSSEPTIEGLTDAQFNALVNKVISDPNSPYKDNPAWKRIIKQRNDKGTESERALNKLAATSPKAAYDYLLDSGYTEANAESYLAGLGVSTSEPSLQPKTGEEQAPVKIDEVAFMQHLNGLGVEYDTLSPEQRTFWKFQYQFNQKQMQPFNEFISKQEESAKEAKKKHNRELVNTGVQELSKHLEDEYGLTLDSDIEGMTIKQRFQDYLAANQNFVGTPKELFYVSHLDYVRDLGKREAAKTSAEENEAKKSIKSEKPGSTGAPSSIPIGVGRDMSDTWSFLSNKHK